jgi:hypothetical protein
MQEQEQTRWDLLLLLALLLVILVYPVLDHGGIKRIILGIVMFVPVILTILSISQIKAAVWPSALSMCGALIFAVADTFFPNPILGGMKWAMLAAFFGIGVVDLFKFLKNSRSISSAHLYTAVSIYLLIGLQWFALYSAIDVFRPGSFLRGAAVATDHQAELLYFSLTTLSTLGYGDILPLNAEVRVLAALESITGVLYIAIMVALLVSAYKRPGNANSE